MFRQSCFYTIFQSWMKNIVKIYSEKIYKYIFFLKGLDLKSEA